MSEMSEDIVSNTEKAAKNWLQRMKEKFWRTSLILIGVILIIGLGLFFFGFMTMWGSNNAPKSAARPLSIQADNGNVAVDVAGDVIQTINIIQGPTPKFAYKVLVPSELRANGEYHTIFGLTLGYSSGVEKASGRFNSTSFSTCQTISAPNDIDPVAEPVADFPQPVLFTQWYNYFYDCSSKEPITDNGTLFQYIP